MPEIFQSPTHLNIEISLNSAKTETICNSEPDLNFGSQIVVTVDGRMFKNTCIVQSYFQMLKESLTDC